VSLLDDARKLVEKLAGPKDELPPETRRPPRPAGSEQDIIARRAALSGAGDVSQNQSISYPGLAELGRSSDRIPAPGTGSQPPSDRAVWRAAWLSELCRRLDPARAAAPAEAARSEETTKATQLLVATIYEVSERLVKEFNDTVSQTQLTLTATGPLEVKEPAGASERPGAEVTYHRCRISSASHSLSVRGGDGLVGFFVLPVSELMLLSRAETPARLRLSLRLCAFGRDTLWTLTGNGMPVDSQRLRLIVQDLFADLVLVPLKESAQDGGLPFSLDLQGEKLAQAVNQLVAERQNLVQKIVTQQEEIQNNIARELHDAVIADVMMLKRSLTGDRALSSDEVTVVLDQITRHLREICHDLSPRDLKDWGLQTVVEDLLERVSERTGADCALSCDTEIPDLPKDVQLHIYRIIQECLTNIEKYAQASRVLVRMEASGGRLTITIEDDGMGFDISETGTRRAREGGSGMGSIRERAALIRCFFPTDLKVESQPSKGSKTTLAVRLTP